MISREAEGREASPSAGVIDSQSVKTTESGGPRGYDAGKKVKGRKRHILTDTQGNLVHAVIHAADIQDRDGAPMVLAEILHRFPWLRHIFADGGYAGDIAHVDPSEAALPWDRLGHWAQDLDDWEEAERCFRKAYELNGGHYGYCLGTALNFLGRHGEALPLVLAQADSIQPDAMSWFQVASAFDHLGRTDEAVAAYRKALVLDPDYAVAMFNMAGVLWNRGDQEEGGRIFRTVVVQFPDHELSAKARQDLPSLF